MPSAVVVSNLLAGAVATASSEHPIYGVDNLIDEVAGYTFRFASAGGGSIDYEFSEATNADTFAVVNHTISESATIQLNLGGSPEDVRAVEWRERDIWVDLGSAAPERLTLTVSDPANDVEIGQLVLGNRIVLPRARRWGMGRSIERGEIAHETVRGVLWVYRLWEEPARRYAWRVMLDELATIEAFNLAVEGRLRPFLWIEDTAKAECFYARLLNSRFEAVEIPDAGIEGYDLEISIRAESRGLSVL
jgi:hypothetical protein